MIMTTTASPIHSRHDQTAASQDGADPSRPVAPTEANPESDGMKDAPPSPRLRSKARRWLLPAAATLCIASWIALGAGVATGAGKGTMLVLATSAALTTEGLVWLSAMLLGLRAFEARRYLFDRVRRAVSRRS
jgi:hypothetical protein